MTTHYNDSIVIDRDGTLWSWSDVWGGYRTPGHMTHGIDTLRTERGPIRIIDDPVELLARDLCDTYYLTVDPARPMGEAYTKVTERTRGHWRAQAALMMGRGWTRPGYVDCPVCGACAYGVGECVCPPVGGV